MCDLNHMAPDNARLCCFCVCVCVRERERERERKREREREVVLLRWVISERISIREEAAIY